MQSVAITKAILAAAVTISNSKVDVYKMLNNPDKNKDLKRSNSEDKK